MASAGRILPSALPALSRIPFPSATGPLARATRIPTLAVPNARRPFFPLRKKFTPTPTTAIRFQHTIPPPPSRQPQSQPQSESDFPKAAQPHYELTFTCNPCGSRSRHRISKHGYHHGSVLVTCPGCRNRHVISDHLKIFGDKSLTIEDLLRERGQLVRKGTLSEDGDLEFWEDGEVVSREKSLEDVPHREAPAVDKAVVQAAPGSTFQSVKPGEKGESSA